MNIKNNREEKISTYSEGDRLSCRVTSLLDYACKVELEEGLEGFVHVKDMAWVTSNIKPSDVVSVGDVIEVCVLEFNERSQSLSLGIKQCNTNPWDTIASRYKEGDRVKACVTKVVDYGCFLELKEGVEGIVYVSEMDWVNHNFHPSSLVSVGDLIEVVILEINIQKQQLYLGIKQCSENPWETFAQKYQLKDTVLGTIQSITDLFIFISLENGLVGLLNPTDIHEEEVLNDLKVGDNHEMTLLSIDAERERICLGIQ